MREIAMRRRRPARVVPGAARALPARPEHSVLRGQRRAGNLVMRRALAAAQPLPHVGPGARVPPTPLSLGSAGDAAERAADAVADQLLRMPEATARARTPASGPAPRGRAAPRPAGPAAAACRAAPALRPGDRAGGGRLVPARARLALRASGRPLDTETRRFFEPRLDRDLGGVRVHTGAGAAAAARALHARAFSYGRDIAFGAGAYAPGTGSGRRLLGHELAHVLQQEGGERPTLRCDDLPSGHPPVRTPERMIADHTEYGDLDETALGQALYLLVFRSTSHVDFVYQVLDALGDSDRDDVAFAFVHPLSDGVLRSLAATDAGRMLLMRLRDEMIAGPTWPSEQTEIDRVNRIGPAAPAARETLARRSIRVQPVVYHGATVDPTASCRRAAEIWNACGVGVTCATPIRVNRAHSLSDLDGDATIDLGVFGSSAEGGAVKARAGTRGLEVPAAFVVEIAAGGLSGGFRGYTARADRVVAVANRGTTETLAHELGHVFGLEHVTSPPRLMHGDGATRTGTTLTAWECSDVRRRL